MSLPKISLVVNKLISPGHGEFSYSDIPAGDGKNGNLFHSVLFRDMCVGGGGVLRMLTSIVEG
jgi:hypothetical protein